LQSLEHENKYLLNVCCQHVTEPYKNNSNDNNIQQCIAKSTQAPKSQLMEFNLMLKHHLVNLI